jgi:hypothetical protein
VGKEHTARAVELAKGNIYYLTISKQSMDNRIHFFQGEIVGSLGEDS